MDDIVFAAVRAVTPDVASDGWPTIVALSLDSAVSTTFFGAATSAFSMENVKADLNAFSHTAVRHFLSSQS